MNKLTAEKCRNKIAMWERLEEAYSLPDHSELHLQAYRIALPILEQQEQNDDEWIAWGGGECPVADDKTVRVRYRGDFQEDKCIAGSMIWSHSGEEDDIIAYRLMDSHQQPVKPKRGGGF